MIHDAVFRDIITTGQKLFQQSLLVVATSQPLCFGRLDSFEISLKDSLL